MNRDDMCAEIAAAHDPDDSSFDSGRSICIRKAVAGFRNMQMPYNSDDEDSGEDAGSSSMVTEYGMWVPGLITQGVPGVPWDPLAPPFGPQDTLRTL
jgi:hypothetical protein